MILQFIFGAFLLVVLLRGIRRLSSTAEIKFELLILWCLVALIVAVGLLVLLKQDLLVYFGVSGPAAAAVFFSVILFTLSFELTRALLGSEKVNREALVQSCFSQFIIENPVIDSKNGHSFLVVIPAFNEEQSLSPVLNQITSLGYDCLVVDDGSNDGTLEIARQAGVLSVRLGTNLGIGSALRLGWKIAHYYGFKAAVQCDADGQHDPKQIERLLLAAEENDLSLVIGSRFAAGAPQTYRVSRLRGIAMKVLARSASSEVDFSFTDATSGFRLIRQPLLGEFARNYPSLYLESYESLILATKAGWRVGEVGVSMNTRTGGTPSHNPLASAKFLVRVVMMKIFGQSITIAPPAHDS